MLSIPALDHMEPLLEGKLITEVAEEPEPARHSSGAATDVTRIDAAAEPPRALLAAAPPRPKPLPLPTLDVAPNELTVPEVVLPPLPLELGKQHHSHVRKKVSAAALLSQPSTESAALGDMPRTSSNRMMLALESARRFDGMHAASVRRTSKLLNAMDKGVADDAKVSTFDSSMHGLRRNRVCVAETLETLERHSAAAAAPLSARTRKPRPPQKKAPFDLTNTVWGPRRKWADSRDFYNTDALRRRMLEYDWHLARNMMPLDEFISKNDDEGAVDKDGDGELDEVVEVREVLWKYSKLIYCTYDYFATLGSHDDVTVMHFNSFRLFVSSCDISLRGSTDCEERHLDQLFIAVNASTRIGQAKSQQGATPAKNVYDDTISLNRNEWVQLLVRISVARYIKTGEETDVSDALYRLFDEKIYANVEKAALHDADAFRARFCYTEPVSLALKRHVESLKSLFVVYADIHAAGGSARGNVNSLESSKLLGLGELFVLINDLHMLDECLTRRYVIFAFVNSRMHVVEEDKPQSRRKIANISFEDFLEFIVRLAVMKALPTDEEIKRSGRMDAGDFILELKQDPVKYSEFVRTRGRKIDEAPLQRVERCVEHLLSLIVRTVERATSTSRSRDGVISMEEARKLVRRFNEVSNLSDDNRSRRDLRRELKQAEEAKTNGQSIERASSVVP